MLVWNLPNPNPNPIVTILSSTWIQSQSCKTHKLIPFISNPKLLIVLYNNRSNKWHFHLMRNHNQPWIIDHIFPLFLLLLFISQVFLQRESHILSSIPISLMCRHSVWSIAPKKQKPSDFLATYIPCSSVCVHVYSCRYRAKGLLHATNVHLVFHCRLIRWKRTF